MNASSVKPLGRAEYTAWGFGLTIFKYVVEYLVVTQFGGQDYGFAVFLSPVNTLRVNAVMNAEPWVPSFILLWSLPFVLVAMWFSLRRCLDAGYTPWSSLWILCPVVNLIFMLMMCFVPTAEFNSGEICAGETAKHDRDTGLWLSTIFTALVLMTGVIVASVYLLQDYGATIFFVAPVMLGVICGYSQQRYRRASGPGKSVLIAMAAVLVGCGVLIVLALEGVVCILMAVPIMLPAAAIGGVIGYFIACSTQVGPSWMTIALLMPSAALVEHALTRPVTYEVVSVVEVDALPSEVWDTVVAFPDIDTPPSWMFRLGVAYPVRARIEGRGAGATRYCEFSTGDFVEPITIWDPPHHLAFSVEDQPCPLTELSPYEEIHPPHLDGFLRSHQGEFRLIELPGGRTRLEGHTWYSVDMYPQIYWKIWTDSIIHSIHYRVLDHIRDVVEK